MEQPKFKGVFASNPQGFRGLVSLKLGAAGRLDASGSASKSATSACCGSRGEAAAARDVLYLWAQRQYGQDGPVPGDELNFPSQRYSSWPGLMDSLAACQTTAEVQALLKHLRDQGTLAALAGTQAAAAPHAAAAAPTETPGVPAAAVTPPAAAPPAAPTPAHTPRQGSGSRGSRELQRLLQSQQEEEAALLHEDLFAAAGSGQPAGMAGRKRTRQQRQQARPPPESAGLSLLLLRGDSQGLGSFWQPDEDGEAGEEWQAAEEEWASPQRRQRLRSSHGGRGAAAQQQPQLTLRHAHREEDGEAEAVAGLMCLAANPAAARAAAAAGRTPFSSRSHTPGGSCAPSAAAAQAIVLRQHSMPARAAEREQLGQAAVPPAPLPMAGSPAASTATSDGSGRSSREQWGHTAEGSGPAGMAVDISWPAKLAGHGPVARISTVQQPAVARELERQRQQRLLSLLGACIQRALAKQQEQQQEQQQSPSQKQAGGGAERSAAPALPCHSGGSPASSCEAEDDATSAAAAAHPAHLLAAAQGLLAHSLDATTALPPAAACSAVMTQQQAQLELHQRLAAALLLYQQQHSLAAAATFPEQQVDAEQQGRMAEQQAAAARFAGAVPCAQVYSAPRLHLPLVQVQVPVQLVSCRPGPVPPSLVMRPAVHKPMCRAASALAHQQPGLQPPSPAAGPAVLPSPPPPPPRQLSPERLALLRSRSLFPQPPITTGHWQMPKGKAKGKPGAPGMSGASKAAPR